MGWGRLLTAVALSALLASPVAARTAKTHQATTTAPATTAAAPQQGGLIDINTATAQQLDKLPGIGPKRAQMIIEHRPYKAKDELVERKIIPKSVYNQIQDKIIARQGSARANSGMSGTMSGHKTK
ncbi:MAG TPA: helix-hairpin-helix domain-containing protein [Stellaceae bacterium]|nr:helix-hairpin-helix domain-containing protein [Stellaceae bacterium]